MRHWISFLILSFFLSGCTALTHVNELLILNDYSNNQQTQHSYVETQNKKFNELLTAIEENRIADYKTKEDFLSAFGEPVVARRLEKGKEKAEEWLYRYSTKFLSSEKVYVYFDQSGKFLDFKRLTPKKASAQPPV